MSRAGARGLAMLACAAWATVSCGKAGPPLPPLVKLPVAPGGVEANRRGNSVDLQFVVPASNTDNSRPANIDRVDVYGFTGSPNLPDDQVFKHATKVASVQVKAPPDPNATIDEDETDEEMQEPEGAGLDQGALAQVQEELTPAASAPIVLPKPKGRTAPDNLATLDRPLVSPPMTAISRTYLAVGINTRGKRGAISKRVSVPLIRAPLPPGAPSIKYGETSITVTWPKAPLSAAIQEEPTGTVLASKPIGWSRPTVTYNVYDAPEPPSADAVAASGPPLTKSPVGGLSFTDNRVEFGADRCYVVRSVRTLDGMSVESDPSPRTCVKLVDTFPPAAPTGLSGVSSEGTINLIWEPNAEADLAGYIVLRDVLPGDHLVPITPTPIQANSYADAVAPGTTYVYAVKAVDKAGNTSAASERTTQTAR